ncbi:MAG: Persistence and stress-resistance toxin PasT [Alphaproteobacteria bacterium MarineAlpha6_Bin4]|nr:MAG: Persistence and stress-resistance toxin PasT [Alphaproteobacteria bacterium MarineAlpha6_Bin4]
MVSFNKNKIISHPIKKIYNLVADVKKYPDFLPWCTNVEIKELTKKFIITEVKVGFQNINETYVCKVLLYPKERITLEYISGPFEYLEIDWKFKKVSKNKTDVSFFCNFKFESIFLRLCTSFFLEDAVEKMVDAFEKKLNN